MQKNKISIIIPVYNEEKTLQQVIMKLKKVNFGQCEVEMIIINDGSSDGTKKILNHIADKNIRIFHKKNGGKGSAVIEGLKHVTGDIIIIQDADLEYNPDDLPKLVAPIEKGETRVVYGSRFKGKIKSMPLPNRIANKILTLLNNILYGKKLTDACTCYKVLDTRFAKYLNLQDQGFDICNEITSKVFKIKETIVELPISYNAARLGNEGKKAKWWNLLKSTWAVLSYKFSNPHLERLSPAKIKGRTK